MKITQATPQAGTFLEELRSQESAPKSGSGSPQASEEALSSPGRLQVSLVQPQPWEGPPAIL